MESIAAPETPAAPAAPAAPPPATPAPEPKTDAAAGEKSLIEDQRKKDAEWLSKLNTDLGYVVKDQAQPVKKEEGKGEHENKEETPAPPDPAATKGDDKKPEDPKPGKKLSVKKSKDYVNEAVEAALKKRETAAPARAEEIPSLAKKVEEPTADPYEESLGEPEREELNFARYAEKANPSAPWAKGLAKRTVDYFKAVDAYYENAKKENPDRTFDEHDTEFQEWVAANRPDVPATDRRKLERQQIVEEAETRAEKKSSAKLEEFSRKQRALEVKPELDKKIANYGETLLESFAAKPEGATAPTAAGPLAEIAKEKGFDALIEEYPMHGPIVKEHWNSSVGLANEYLQLARGLKNYDHADPNHRWLANFVETESARFKAAGGEATVIDGRTFVTPSEFNRLSRTEPAKASKHWTLSVDDVLGIIQIYAQQSAEQRLTELNQQLEKAGFKRVAATNGKPKDLPKSEKAKAPETEHQAPKAKPSMAPGAGANNPPVQGDRPFSSDELGLLVTRK